MRTRQAWLSLALAIISASSHLTYAQTLPSTTWPAQLPASVKYYPNEESALARASAVQAVLATRQPIGMRKTPDSEGDMFFLEYWQFDADGEAEIAGRLARDAGSLVARDMGVESQEKYNNATIDIAYLHAPIRPHAQIPSAMRLFARQSFQCPANSNNCGYAGNSDVCCPSGQTCVKVSNTNGVGNVGCCPSGQTCVNQVSSCNTAAGYQSCPGSSNGGCCIPGFTCLGVGCISTVTSYTTTTLPTITVGGGAGPNAITTTTTCPAGAVSCAASLGGGCCSSGQMCWTGTTCLTRSDTSTSTSISLTTTTVLASAPLRPIPSTTDTPIVSTVTTGPITTVAIIPAVPPGYVTTGTSTITFCPTSYYLCSAYYIPGCCSIGRDCAVRDCPAAASSSAIVSNGVTIVVPAGSSITGGATVVSTTLTTATIASNAIVVSTKLGIWTWLIAVVGLLNASL